MARLVVFKLAHYCRDDGQRGVFDLLVGVLGKDFLLDGLVDGVEVLEDGI